MRDLKELIKCCGYAGTAGQSFRNNVTGAATGVKMSDYNFTAWDWNTGLPAQPDSGVRYTSGGIFVMSGSMTCGSKCHYILRQGTNLGIIIAQYAIQAEGDDVQVTADSVSDTAMSASVKVIGQVNPGAFPLSASSVSGIAHYYYGGGDQTSPPANNDPVEAHFHASPNGTAPDGGYLDMTWTMQIINPNTGTGIYNPDPTPFTCIARVNNRGLADSDFTYEWYSDSGYTSLFATGADAFWYDQVNAGDDFSLWLRFRFQGGSWINHGQVTFTDTRSGI